MCSAFLHLIKLILISLCPHIVFCSVLYSPVACLFLFSFYYYYFFSCAALRCSVVYLCCFSMRLNCMFVSLQPNASARSPAAGGVMVALQGSQHRWPVRTVGNFCVSPAPPHPHPPTHPSSLCHLPRPRITPYTCSQMHSALFRKLPFSVILSCRSLSDGKGFFFLSFFLSSSLNVYGRCCCVGFLGRMGLFWCGCASLSPISPPTCLWWEAVAP